MVLDKYSSIIFSNISKNLRIITNENIKEPKLIKMNLIERSKEDL